MALIGSVLGDIAGSQYEFSNLRPDDLDWKITIYSFIR